MLVTRCMSPCIATAAWLSYGRIYRRSWLIRLTAQTINCVIAVCNYTHLPRNARTHTAAGLIASLLACGRQIYLLLRYCYFDIPHFGGAENDGHEVDGHENAGHVSGVWVGLHGIDFDLAVLPSNRLILRFQECSRSKSKLKTIRLYSDDHCVFHTCMCLSIILQLQEVYTTYFAAVTCILPLFWKELHTALQCNLFSNDISCPLISCPSFSVNPLKRLVRCWWFQWTVHHWNNGFAIQSTACVLYT